MFRSWKRDARFLLFVAFMAAGCSATHRATVQQPPAAGGQPLEVEFVYNLPIVTASIGDEDVRLIVDVGGHDTIALSNSVIERLPTISRVNRRNMSFNAAGKMSIDRRILVPELRLGEVVAADVEGSTVQLPAQLAEQVDGYVGAALLSQFRLLVEYPQRVVLYSVENMPADFDASRWIAVPLDSKNRCEAAINGQRIDTGWDTGASHTVMDDDAAAKMNGPAGDRLFGSLTLGLHTFEDIELRVIELRGTGVDLLIGHNFFLAHRVLFDFPGKTVYIEPDENQPRVQASLTQPRPLGTRWSVTDRRMN